MFTGIIEEKGIVKNIHQNSQSAFEFKIKATKILEDINIGDSISIDGVCLTVTNFTDTYFQVDIMPETVKATSIKTIKENQEVNLERAMLATTRLGGHFVTGHVDGIGKIIKKEKMENAIYYTIEIPEKLTKYLINKGSITIDGISLTVFDITNEQLVISLIPHTVKMTGLGTKSVGDVVNVECDLLAKHVEKQLETRKDNHYV